MIVGTAGHIDHGKTSLVRCLTGIDTDRLREEKERGITIELGFAYIPDANGNLLGFVDVPGHERLIHTMIAGAASIDTALVVVAADDGVMPQTIEHLQILDLLNITSGIVAITKIDTVDPARVSDVETRIRDVLRSTGLSSAPIVPVSSTTGEGVSDIKAWLMSQMAKQKRRTSHKHFRLPVDRSFSLPGAGLIVTGTVLSGSIRVGEEVAVFPIGRNARVRSLHAMNRSAEAGVQGDRCALNLKGASLGREDIQRGDWILSPVSREASDRCDVLLKHLEGETRPLKHWTPALLHHGAQQIDARIVILDRQLLQPGEEGLAQLITAKPLPFRYQDRIILRDVSAQRTIAGARVLDPAAPDRNRRKPARLAYLNGLTSTDAAATLASVLNLPPYLMSLSTLSDWWGLSAAGIAEIKGAAIEIGGGYLCSPQGLSALSADISAALARLHAKESLKRGLVHDAVRTAMSCRLSKKEFDAIATELASRNVIAGQDGLLSLAGHEVRLTDEAAARHRKIREALGREPFKPPRITELASIVGASEVELRRTCKALAKAGFIVEIAIDHFFLKTAVDRIVDAAEQLSTDTSGQFSAAQFRDRLGNGRQLAIQILNYLDRRSITHRKGETRRFVKRPQQTAADAQSW